MQSLGNMAGLSEQNMNISGIGFNDSKSSIVL